MKKWAVIEKGTHDEWVKPYATKEEAIANGKAEWGRMTKHDQDGCEFFLVGLVNLDADGNYAELDNGLIDADIYEVAWQAK